MTGTVIRARQRGRDGLPPLDPVVAPKTSEMLIDKLQVRVPGIITHPNGVDAAIDQYRQLWDNRSPSQMGCWKAARHQAHKFETEFGDSQATLKAKLICTNEKDRAKLSLKLTLNPTRTLVHALAHRNEDVPLADFAPETFFSKHPRPCSAITINGDDNAVAYGAARSAFPSDLADVYLRLFEINLKRWALDALAPRSRGFQYTHYDLQPVARSGELSVCVLWAKLVVGYAEAYCDRRHSGAKAAMEAYAARLQSVQSESTLHRYQSDESNGLKSIRFYPAQHVVQSYYAKCVDRIRIETRYSGRVNNVLRYPTLSRDAPLFSLLQALRTDAVRRAGYATFCAMIEPPNMLTVDDVARFLGTVAECAAAANVHVAPVVHSLLATGSIDQTDDGGRAPIRLITALQRAHIIERVPVARRRPGQPIRYTLVAALHEAARKLQQAFDNRPDQTQGVEQAGAHATWA